MARQNKKIMLHKNKLFYVMLIAVCVALGVYFLLQNRDYNAKNEAPEQYPGELAPATEEEKAETEAHKKELANQKPQQPPTSGSTQSVKPLITYSGQDGSEIEVISYVPGISEDGGKCILVLTRGSDTVTREVSANRNSRTTDCEAFKLQRSDFISGGDWGLIVTYESSSTKGESDKSTINIK